MRSESPLCSDRRLRRVERGVPKLAARADSELGEHLVQVPLDGSVAEEEPRADLGVGETVAREPRNLLLLRRERLAPFAAPSAGLLACRDELDPSAFRERFHPDRGELVMRSPERGTRVGAAAL